MKPADVYFEVETPLGVKIRTTKDYWKKIITIKHPIIAKYEKQVKESLRKPTEIRRSKQDPSVYLYYKNLGNVYVCTVCDHVDSKNGYIITAYLTKRIREGEIVSKAFLRINVEN